jgi:hypothetical protein
LRTERTRRDHRSSVDPPTDAVNGNRSLTRTADPGRARSTFPAATRGKTVSATVKRRAPGIRHWVDRLGRCSGASFAVVGARGATRASAKRAQTIWRFNSATLPTTYLSRDAIEPCRVQAGTAARKRSRLDHQARPTVRRGLRRHVNWCYARRCRSRQGQ